MTCLRARAYGWCIFHWPRRSGVLAGVVVRATTPLFSHYIFLPTHARAYCLYIYAHTWNDNGAHDGLHRCSRDELRNDAGAIIVWCCLFATSRGRRCRRCERAYIARQCFIAHRMRIWMFNWTARYNVGWDDEGELSDTFHWRCDYYLYCFNLFYNLCGYSWG